MNDQDVEAATWAGLEVEVAERQGRDQAVLHAVTVALRTLRAANLAPSFGFDAEDAETLWAARVKDYTPAAIITAAGELAGREGGTFPTLAEFAAQVGIVHRRAIDGDHPKREPGSTCHECSTDDENGIEGRVQLSDPTLGGSGTVRPCSICRPAQFALWKATHFGPQEGTFGCRCSSPECPRRRHGKAS